MTSHIRALALINIFRALCGAVLAAAFIWFSRAGNIPTHRFERVREGDLIAFLVIGIAILGIALVRGWQGASTLAALRRARRAGGRNAAERRAALRWSRRVGFGLAIFDFIDLTLFPVSTACGLYGFLVYRHPDTIDFYEGKFSLPQAPLQHAAQTVAPVGR